MGGLTERERDTGYGVCRGGSRGGSLRKQRGLETGPPFFCCDAHFKLVVIPNCLLVSCRVAVPWAAGASQELTKYSVRLRAGLGRNRMATGDLPCLHVDLTDPPP